MPKTLAPINPEEMPPGTHSEAIDLARDAMARMEHDGSYDTAREALMWGLMSAVLMGIDPAGRRGRRLEFLDVARLVPRMDRIVNTFNEIKETRDAKAMRALVYETMAVVDGMHRRHR